MNDAPTDQSGDLAGYGEDYRTCSTCGGDCVPDPTGADGLGVRIVWVCPAHGVHSIVDPFGHLR